MGVRVGQAGSVTTYRERLTAPPSWWAVVVVFGLVCGWIMLVVTTTAIAIGAAVLGAVAAGSLVWGYGSVVVEGGRHGLRVGSAHIPAEHIADVEVLDPAAFRERLGPGADARAWLRTRPYVEAGVRVNLADPSDPTPYWLISCRRPQALADALRDTEDTNDGEVHGGEEEV